MYDQFLNKRTYVLLAIFIIVVIVLLIPLKMPFSINAAGKVMAGQQWSLARQTDGSIISTIYDYSRDITDSYAAYQIDREDVFHFQMLPELKNVSSVMQGDTVGYIFSNLFFQELSGLEGALELAKANLEVVSTGEKESIINEARDQFLLNQERSLVQNEILQRQSRLYQDALISKEDFEVTRGMSRIYELETKVAAAHLITVQIGEKPEIIEQARVQINVLEDELRVLRLRLSDYTLTAPIAGNINIVSSPDTLLLVTDDKRIVWIPIPWQFFNDVDTNLTFTLKTKYASETINGSIKRKSNYMRLIGGQQVFIVTGILEDKRDDLPINMLVQCSISGMKRTIWDYVKYFLQALI